jgi:septal ring factor EnvC (AmiA/AmiB activator)
VSKHRGGKSRRQNTREETPRDNSNLLKDVIKRQQKEINSLRKELNRKVYETNFVEEPIARISKQKCTYCGSESIQEIWLGIRKVIKCTACNRNKVLKTPKDEV